MKEQVFSEEVRNYQTPEVEIVEVEVEKGFEASGDGFGGTDTPGTGA